MMKPRDLPDQQICAAWSNRILLLSLLGIGYLTLFPFHFVFNGNPAYRVSPFFLGMNQKPSGPLDFFLNVLLFVPFGFGISAQVCKRGRGRWISFLLALALGAFTSYTVEFLQLFIPQRDSGWEDVLSNSMGSVAGFILFAICGRAILRVAAQCEELFLSWLSVRRAAALLVAYFAVWFGISTYLQNKTRLTNWDTKSPLYVGNDASGENPWEGKLYLLQIWNRALPADAIRRMAGRESMEDESVGLLANYDFTSSQPLADKMNFLPPLTWTPEQPQSIASTPVELDGKSWLSTKSPVENLVREIRKTSHFTIHVVVAPAEADQGRARIFSLSTPGDDANLNLRHQRSNMVFYFRNPLSAGHSALVWFVPSVFEAGKIRDLAAVYDGSDAYLYLDGTPVPQNYRLSPGASLMHSFFFIQTGDLDGYVIFYEAITFLPAGFLIGLAAGKWLTEKTADGWLLVAGWILPALLLEFYLAWHSGRRIWVGNIALALGFGLAGILMINADRDSNNVRGASAAT